MNTNDPTSLPATDDPQELRQRLSEVTAELNRCKRTQEAFMACMSHELRTPLNSVLGLSEALSEQIYGDMNAEQLETVAQIEKGGRDLLALVNNILDLARIGSGDLHLELGPISIQDTCQAVVGSFREKAVEQGISLTCNVFTQEIFHADEVRVRQMLTHLIDNAIKFTPVGGTVSIDAIVDHEDHTVHLAVIDSGVGIESEEISTLFERFKQLDGSIRREHSGTGLGLSIVYQLAELHGGCVSVESKVGDGSRFVVSLPLGAAADGGASSVGASPVFDIKHALVVEDEAAAADQMCRYLKERGIETTVCSRGDEAMTYTLRLKPDIVVLDIQLPGLFGWEVMERLKLHPETKHIPIIVASVVDERARARSLGATEYLVKPVNRNQLGYALCKVAAACQTPPENALASVEAGEPQAPDDRPNILLAEDNEANIKTLTDYLNAKGYNVSVARDGLEAVEQAASMPDIILMDIQMPNMNGIEAMEKIQTMESISHIPIVALTALAMPGDRERCLAAGALDYLSKPVSLKALNAVIERLIYEDANRIPA